MKKPIQKPSSSPSDSQSQRPAVPGFTGSAFCIVKTPNTMFLSQGMQLTIQDGVVVGIRPLNPEDMPASSIGNISKELWSQYRSGGGGVK